MIKLELTKSQFKNLVLNFELGRLIYGDVVEEDREAALDNANLRKELYKAGVEGGSGITKKDGDKNDLTPEIEDEIDGIYEQFIEFVESGEYAKEMEALKMQIEEMRKKGKI